MDWNAFFTVHRDLPREGPGEPADVLWALKTAGVPGAVTVLDAACGPGADTVTLADALPDATITGMDGIYDRVKAAGNSVTGTRLVVGAPWEAHYAPMVARIAKLRAGTPSPTLTQALDLCAREPELWATSPEHIAYALCVVQPE
jgi:hypothetical protein